MAGSVGQLERLTQDRVVKLFAERLGFDYLGSWARRDGNANIERELLETNLEARGYGAVHIRKAVVALQRAAAVGGGRKGLEANRDVYSLLRYGVKVQADVGHTTETVWLVDWEHVEANHFAIVEEVTVKGQADKRPDLVLYVNGIAVAVIELKRSKVAVGEGIRQTIGNQKSEFIGSFFSTVQLVMAGNDVEGLHYAVIETPERYWLKWKLPIDVPERLRAEIEEACAGVDEPLDRALAQLCDKARLLEVIHDFTVFDAGVRKVCRPNQYFGVKAAQARVVARDGGIVWHTQGSGKSLTMVWLAKWLREHHNARVLLVTDRTELDEQIEKVFAGVDERIYRTSSGADLLATLNATKEWLICSLVHKFRSGSTDADPVSSLERAVPASFTPKGNVFVFVDEAHRTQSGKLHGAMKKLLPDALFIGFTGTPLLKRDKATSIRTFGSFIHTYKFDEAVSDDVVLDLRYEARDVDQWLSSPDHVDRYFAAKTKGMTESARNELMRRWGTLKALYSSSARAERIVQDVLLDLDTKPRLANGRGNAVIVSATIHQACKLYELFCRAGFEGKCAIVTSYEPDPAHIANEDAGAGHTEALEQFRIYRQMLADFFDEPADTAVRKVEQFERKVKQLFITQPGRMRLLIVVDKLLTGFDAPPATYLYIDKKMRDHGLFQAICRVNRLDGDDKEYGYIVDYQDLFKSLHSAVVDYTSEALDGYDPADVAGLLTDRLSAARSQLDDALKAVRAVCEGVEAPRGTRAFQRFFCAADDGDVAQLLANEPKRLALYKAVATLARAFAAIANELEAAGYTEAQAAAVAAEVKLYVAARDEVRLGSGDHVDFKRYEADMRWLLDTYVEASPSTLTAELDDAGLIDVIARMGPAAIERLPGRLRGDEAAVGTTIVNNVRRRIVDEGARNPRFFASMSELLEALIEEHRRGVVDYEDYLQRLVALAKQVASGERAGSAYPAWADNGARRALIDLGLPGGEPTAQAVDEAVVTTKEADWVGTRLKEKRVRNAVRKVVGADYEGLDELMELVKARQEYR